MNLHVRLLVGFSLCQNLEEREVTLHAPILLSKSLCKFSNLCQGSGAGAPALRANPQAGAAQAGTCHRLSRHQGNFNFEKYLCMFYVLSTGFPLRLL